MSLKFSEDKEQNLQVFFFNYIYALWKCIYTSIENPIQLKLMFR